MGVTAASTGSASAGPAALAAAAQRVSDLAVEAAELDERAAAVVEREGELEGLAATLAEERARQLARAAELDERERSVARQQVEVEEQGAIVASREALVAEMQEELLEQARALQERAQRFRWRWFLRAWAWRPRVGGATPRVCELFLVPSSSGYKLLEQTGVAVAPNARISGLLDEDASYVVTKVAQLPFDGRWCAYLEINTLRGGTTDD
jgi:chromosome segregation ATPase